MVTVARLAAGVASTGKGLFQESSLAVLLSFPSHKSGKKDRQLNISSLP
jgi:hypothetical protein